MSQSAARNLPIALVVSCAMFMEFLDSTVILTALPKMSLTFGVTPVSLSMGITAYLLAVAVLLPASGWIADHYGTRTVFMSAICGFILSSMWCGLCVTRWEFILARTVQGASAALMSPVGRLAILRSVDRSSMARAMNMGSMAALMGPLIGPPLGGLITDVFSWRWIFIINVPIGLGGLYFVRRLIPNYKAPEPRPFDVRGFVLNGSGLASALYGLQLLGERGSSWPLAAALLAGGALLLVHAWRHARRVAHPLVPLDALYEKLFLRVFTGGTLFRLALFAPHFALALLLQLGLGMSAARAGTFMACNAAADVLAKLFIIRTLRSAGHRRVLLWSATLYSLYPLGLLACTRNTPAAVLVAILGFGGVMRSYQMTASNTLQMGVVKPEHLTGASTLWALTLQLSQTVSITLAAMLLQVAAWWRGGSGENLVLADFRLVMLVATASALLALVPYRGLARDVGADISGYSKAAG